MDPDFNFLIQDDVSGLDPVMYQYYHQMNDNRTLILNTDIDERIVEMIYLPMRDWENDSDMRPVTLILNSQGGCVSDGFFLAQYISQYKKPLHIIVPGYAASMAAVILAGGGKNENVTRFCFPSTYALIHDGYVALSASEAKTANDIMAFNNKVDEDIRKFIIDNTNITAEEYDTHARHQWFLSSDEMKQYNLVDKIYGVDA
jgi:ATP-dependent Clp protease protease subunit